jgi:hypothetical protein
MNTGWTTGTYCPLSALLTRPVFIIKGKLLFVAKSKVLHWQHWQSGNAEDGSKLLSVQNILEYVSILWSPLRWTPSFPWLIFEHRDWFLCKWFWPTFAMTHISSCQKWQYIYFPFNFSEMTVCILSIRFIINDSMYTFHAYLGVSHMKLLAYHMP